jgi:diaminopimelate epimerase/tRNA dimethylallyltransferase
LTPTEHLALVGPTASGKSELALHTARALGDVEIVSMDSMQVYRGLDIGTAKPSPADRAAVPHHLIDVADPSEEWSVARFQADARRAVGEIEARGHRALLVGGTGLYVQAVIDDLRFPGESPDLRAALEARTAEPGGVAATYAELARRDPEAAARIDPHNARRIVRALEVIELTGQPFSSFGPGVAGFGPTAFPVRLAGVWLPRGALAGRIDARVDRRSGRGGAPPAGRPVAHRAPGDRVQGAARCSRGRRSRRRVRHHRPPHPVVRAPPADVVPAGSADHVARDGRQSVRVVAGAPGNVEPMTLHLSKLHATGNDFLVLSVTDGDDVTGMLSHQARALCDRHRGIGADGLILVGPGRDGADCHMKLFNADGRIAEMSGNGMRCLAWAAVRDGLGDGRTLTVDTDAGRRVVDLERDDRGEVVAATVDMGPVTFVPAEIPLDAPSAFDLEVSYHGVTYDGDAAGIGNPHLVLFVDDLECARVTQHGPHLERDERFPNGVNVEFVAVDGDAAIRMRVWERGVGETLSCGTGACAAAAVAQRRGLVGDHVTVHVAGGDLTVELGDSVRLGGPVVHVFDVDVDPEAIVGIDEARP